MRSPSPRRLAGLLTAIVAGTAALVAVAGPAHAASLGTLTITPTAGTIGANPAFTSATTGAGCPATHGQNAKLRAGKVGGPYGNLAAVAGGGTYGNGPFTLVPDRALAQPLGATPAGGDYEIVVECLGETTGLYPDRFIATITVTGSNWTVKGAQQPPGTPTTTTLAVEPAGPVSAGTAVTLRATVAPAAAAGAVTFSAAGRALGTAPVSAGAATLTTSELPAGEHSLTAAFVPTAAGQYAGSTSAAVTLKVNGRPTGGITKGQTVTADVAGEFSLTVAGDAVTLSGGSVGGQAVGDLKTAKVTDLRGTNAGWDLTGQVEQFTSGTGQTITANQLGWAPTVTKVQGTGTGLPGADLAPGSGLGTAKTLCKAAPTSSAGVYDCGAKLTLGIPDTAAPGSYTATLTLTLA